MTDRLCDIVDILGEIQEKINDYLVQFLKSPTCIYIGEKQKQALSGIFKKIHFKNTLQINVNNEEGRLYIKELPVYIVDAKDYLNVG